MTDEDRVLELLAPFGRNERTKTLDAVAVVPLVAKLAEALAQVRAETVERCVAAVRAVDSSHETTNVTIGIDIGLAKAEHAIRSLPPATEESK